MSTKSKKNHQRLLQTNCHIGIVGSGLGGLSAALAILQCGKYAGGEKQKVKATHNKSEEEETETNKRHSICPVNSFQGRITIYERDLHASDRKEGYGMTLTYNPNGPLAQLGILESIAKRDCPSRCHYLFNEKGEVKGYYGNAFHDIGDERNGTESKQSALRGAGQRGNLRIPRAELRSILLEKIRKEDESNNPPRVRIEWGKQLQSYIDRSVMKTNDPLQWLGQTATNNVTSDNSNKTTSKRDVLLQFKDGSTDEVDLLIGADGVNSVVAKQYLSMSLSYKSHEPSSHVEVLPQYLGIFIVIGITTYMHPLIDERGYYTLDGEHRLFIMPFQGSQLDDQMRRTMWQLSYPIPNRDEALRLSRLSSEELQQEILKRCNDWHAPFPEMVKKTSVDTIWGTGLFDRDPDIFIQQRQLLEIHGRIPSHVVLLGDAAHAMSPFKGSGANQALADGPLLTKWLQQSKFDSAVRGYMSEMARRSGVKVRSSREAAKMLHSQQCWEWMASEDGVTSGTFHGVDPDNVKQLLDTFKNRSVGASLGAKLDESIRAIIKEMGILDAISYINTADCHVEELRRLQNVALEHASNGHLQQLREISTKSRSVIPNARDSSGRTCLHLAAFEGHLDVCRWLLFEANLDPKVHDQHNKTALDGANENGNQQIVQAMKSWIKRKISPERTSVPDTEEVSSESDMYRQIEQQLRPIRTMQQLRSLLQHNRQNTNNNCCIKQVIGFPLDSADEEDHMRREQILAHEHGATILRNYVAKEVDQLALGALALRPLNLYIPSDFGLQSLGSTKEHIRKQFHGIKSQISIPTSSPIIAQTNFGPQLAQTCGNASKKQKIEYVALSKLRYLNIGEWNYNWGDRKYEKIPLAKPFPVSFSRFAERAYEVAQQQVLHYDHSHSSRHTSKFDMAICNFYHLERPSDRLGGHKDDVESDLTSPLITISLGAPAIFLLGGKSRSCVPTAILLRAGDCMVMGGKSRKYFHGVPTVLEFEDGDISQSVRLIKGEHVFPDLKDDMLSEVTNESVELLFVKAFLATTRMNISIRQI